MIQVSTYKPNKFIRHPAKSATPAVLATIFILCPNGGIFIVSPVSLNQVSRYCRFTIKKGPILRKCFTQFC